MIDSIKKVDIERLYQHVLSVEGIKHPFVNPEKLNETADYIKSEFQKYGLSTNEQSFEIEGTDMTFRNIEGYIGDGSKSEILVTSHYDTVRNAPGANDNGSAIAAMLEAARVLASEENVGSVRFISFTLEELQPTLVQQYRDRGLELGIIDKDYRYTSHHSHKMIKKFFSKVSIKLSKGKPMLESWEKSFDEIKDDLTDSEKKYCEYIIESRSHITRTSWIGELGLVGSDYWVKKAIEDDKKIIGVINLETIGYTSKRKNSQFLPPLMHPILFPTYKVKARKIIGDFISVVSDKNSKELGKLFCKKCKLDDIKLPYLWARIPLRFEKIAKWLSDTLRSDHAPFWRENIPALLITDTANFRYPYYHTEADTIDKLDFEFIKKITQATIATVLDRSEINV
ncbi:MAG: M28 family peptidase [Candidatus Heimdallarchaeota archaeon]|nr:M28 family peptidase [Candidatus Heimdallarchaeota archaeon]MCK5143568.1 M28 family peptidase [Candidatus Heimdallarchaeota archaeon]